MVWYLASGIKRKRWCIIACLYMASPKTDTIQYRLLFSHLTVQQPSVALSQKQELAVCKPAPDFCMIVQLTVLEKTTILYSVHKSQMNKKGNICLPIYLNGF